VLPACASGTRRRSRSAEARALPGVRPRRCAAPPALSLAHVSRLSLPPAHLRNGRTGSVMSHPHRGTAFARRGLSQAHAQPFRSPMPGPRTRRRLLARPGPGLRNTLYGPPIGFEHRIACCQNWREFCTHFVPCVSLCVPVCPCGSQNPIRAKMDGLMSSSVVRTDANLSPTLHPVGPKNSIRAKIDGLTSSPVVRTDANFVPILYPSQLISPGRACSEMA
jgi:hypothetical protein